MAERFLVSIHGVETDGAWQEKIDPAFEGIDGFAYRKHHYGVFKFWEAAVSSSREGEVERFAEFYDQLMKEGPRSVSVIAHSFGTYVVGTSLLRFPSIRFDAIILCGSILASEYDWPLLFSTDRVRRVLNERAGDDWVVNKFRWPALRGAIAGTGPTGVDGFANKPANFKETLNPQFQHSDHFILVEHCNRFWRPFIFDNEEFAALSWECVEGNGAARDAFRAKYQPVVQRLVMQLFPEKTAEAAAERSETILDAIALDGARGIHNAYELAVQKVGKLWIARERARTT